MKRLVKLWPFVHMPTGAGHRVLTIDTNGTRFQRFEVEGGEIPGARAPGYGCDRSMALDSGSWRGL